MSWVAVFFALAALCFATAVWLWVCNIRTYSQRQKVLMAIRDSDDFWSGMRRYDAVSYERHLWHLATLRNAMKLYSEPQP